MLELHGKDLSLFQICDRNHHLHPRHRHHHLHHRHRHHHGHFRRQSLYVIALSFLVFISVTTAAQNDSESLGDSDNGFNLTDYDDIFNTTNNNSTPVDLDNVTASSNFTEFVPPPEIHKIALIQNENSLPLEEINAIQSMIEDEHFHLESIMIQDLEPTFHNFRRAVKSLKPEKPRTILGPYSLTFAVVAEQLGIPYIVTSPIPIRQPVSDFLIFRLFPESHVFARAVVDMLAYYNLKKIVVFFQSEKGEAIVEKLAGISKIEVTAFHVTNNNVGELRERLKTVRDKYFTSFVCVLDKEVTKNLFDEAVSLSMFSPRYKWLMVNMGMEEYHLEKYADSYANVTVIRLMMDYNSTDCDLDALFINMKRSVFHDALKLTKHLEEYMDTRRMNENIRTHVKRLQMHGCTGDLMFSREGHRTESFLQLMTLEAYRAGAGTCGIEKSQTSATFVDRKGNQHVLAPSPSVVWCDAVSGTWRSNRSLLTERIDPSKSYSIVSKLSENVFGNSPLRITTIMEPPFVQKKDPNSLETNHPVYEGFCIDILVEMSKLLGFSYNITMVPDGKFGSKKPLPKGWTGMVRQLIDDKADLALAPFQMSLERAEVVDFTKPFMTKGTTVVIKRPEQRIWMFQFLSPLNKMVWFAIFIAFVGVSMMLFAVSRVNSDKQAKYTSNLRESFWYIWGTLLRGSLNGSPSAISSRIVSSVWWFFCLIISSIYTANLAAFLTITNNDVGMSTAADLAMQSEYEYGTVEGSATETFFKHTKMTYYTKMWAQMNIKPESMSRRVKIGFERAKKGKYAFIWDSPPIRHLISNDCDLMELGSPFDLKGYGFAIQKNALVSERVSWALLTLNDRGVLYKLESKWFRPQFCPHQKRSAKSQSLHLETVAGMYVIILSGAVISTLICLLQYFIREIKGRKKRKSMEDHNKDATDDGNGARGNNFVDNSPRDEIMYANHSPLQFRSMTEWT